MTEVSQQLPIRDVLTELKKKFSVTLLSADLNNREHLREANRLNHETAAVGGQVSIETNKQEPDSNETVEKWVGGKLGYFRFVVDNKNNKIIGGVWSLEDTHTTKANQVLKQRGETIELSSNSSEHREASSYIYEKVKNAEQKDKDASLQQLAEEFKLGEENSNQTLKTIAVYMDEVEESDRVMMKELGFAISADGVEYEGSDPCTVFIATQESVKQAIIVRAKQVGIDGGAHSPAMLK